MRVCRYENGTGQASIGVVEDDGTVREFSGALRDLSSGRVGDAVGDIANLRLLPPTNASKAICVGRNYRSLLEAQGRDAPSEPFIFLKASSSLTGSRRPIYMPAGVEDLAYEGEIAVVIEREARQVKAADVGRYIFGLTLANDVTVRDWQHPTAQWWRAKSSDSHCPMGPWVDTDANWDEPREIRTFVNGELRQRGTLAELVFGIPELLEHISAHMTLYPGDVILTGTPAGIRAVQPGDVVTVEADGLGVLENTVEPWPN